MKNKFYLFSLFGVILLFCACEENSKTQETITAYEDIKPVLPKSKIVKKELPKPPKEYCFQFEDLYKQQINVKIKDNIYLFQEFSEPIVLLNIFSTWCPPCVGQIPHLNNLQSRYKEKLFILGTVIHDTLKDEELKVFIESQKINFFVAKMQKRNMEFIDFIAPKLQLKQNFPLPVMILFVNGRYYTHYEGSIPEEMIESDIKQALNKI